MSDQLQQMRHRDDAPVTAAKDTDPDRALTAEAVTINSPPEDIFAFWRDPANLARIMDNVVSVEVIDDVRSRWTVKAPGGREVSWVSAITHEEPGRSLTWQSEPGGDVDNSGKVSFSPARARGTVVRVTIAYEPPGGTVGRLLAKLFQREPRIQARRELHRLKQWFEAGEIATSARNAREFELRQGGIQ